MNKYLSGNSERAGHQICWNKNFCNLLGTYWSSPERRQIGGWSLSYWAGFQQRLLNGIWRPDKYIHIHTLITPSSGPKMISHISHFEWIKTGRSLQSSAAVWDLGVQLDAELSMKQHINKTVAVCYFHLCRLRQIRRRVGSEVTTRLVQAFILSRLDYCNSVLAALPESTIGPLQHVQNAAARLIFGLRTSDHITDSLIQLHWLPIRWRIQYKLCLMMHSIYRNSDRSPAYLADMVQPASTRSTWRLQSRESGLFDVPCLRTKFGERAFSFSGPSAWNALPIDIRDETCTAAFKRKLKTFYFSQAFDCVWFLFYFTRDNL